VNEIKDEKVMLFQGLYGKLKRYIGYKVQRNARLTRRNKGSDMVTLD